MEKDKKIIHNEKYKHCIRNGGTGFFFAVFLLPFGYRISIMFNYIYIIIKNSRNYKKYFQPRNLKNDFVSRDS